MDRIETTGEHTRLCEHSPQLPQGFTPVGNLTFWPGQLLGILSHIPTYSSGTPGESAYLTTDSGKQAICFRIVLACLLPSLADSLPPILAGETLEATCDFNSLERETVTSAGSTHHDEMCNLYMMMWSELPVFMTCSGGGTWNDNAYVNMHGPGENCAHPRAQMWVIYRGKAYVSDAVSI